MSQTTPNIPDYGTQEPSQPPKAIGHLAARGMAWSVAQAMGSKCITMLQQIVIAKYFLSHEDFGLFAMAQVVISIASFGQTLGVGDILVRRHRRFARWVDAGFWFNLTGGLLGMLLTLGVVALWDPVFGGISHLLGRQEAHAPRVQGLLALWSLWLPMDAILQIMVARLRVDMRFRFMATFAALQVVAIATLSLAFAWLGFGPYSLVLPMPLFTPVTVAIGWWFSRQRIRLRPDIRRWRALLRDSRFMLLGNMFNVLLQNADYMVTSLFFSEVLLGAYYFAYRMSTQTLQLISGNVTSVLTTSFSKIDTDEVRRSSAYERTCAALALLGMPLCFLQALLAEPGLRLIYGHKWDDAIVPFEILSLGMAFAIPMPAATSLLLAQGRYRVNVIWTGISALGFVTCVFLGAACGSIIYVAAGVGIFFATFGPVTVALPVLRFGAAGIMWRVLRFPLAAGILATAGGWALSMLVPTGGIFVALFLRTLGWGLVMAGAVALVRPVAARELAARLPVLRKFVNP